MSLLDCWFADLERIAEARHGQPCA
jgi:hypothetical protein